MTPLSLSLYGAATRLLEPFAPGLLRARARRGKEDPARLDERLGRSDHPRPPGALAWLHGASVGESLSLLPLIEALQTARPELALLVTSGTRTSAALLAQRLPAGVIHQFAPVDGPGAMGRFLDHWRPDLLVLAESELWPNLLIAARRRDVRTALVSARITAHTARGWTRARRAARALLGGFDLVLPQDDATAARIAGLGGRDDGRLNLKLLGAPLPVDPRALAAARTRAAGRPVLLAASTHPGEEAVVLDAFARQIAATPDSLLVIVPRHPERGGAVAAEAQARGVAVGRQGAGETFGETPVFVADALGELGLWYRLAAGAFIGGSLIAGPGGHNPVEAAQLGCAIATGPHLDNWASVYAPLLAADAFYPVTDAESLADAFVAFAQASPLVAERAGRAAALGADQQAALDDAVGRLLGLVGP